MSGHNRPPKAKAGTIEDFEEYRRGGGGGNGDDDGPRGLWQIFNDKISDMTQELRTGAREVIRKEQLRLEEQFAAAGHAGSDYNHHKTFKKLEEDLSRTRKKIADGGVKGAITAAVVIWNAPRQPAQSS